MFCKKWKKTLWLLLFITAFDFSGSPTWARHLSNKYDDQIKYSVKRYWPDYPIWQEWKAQLFQESTLDPNAVSHVGARGLAQFMPGTWAQISRELGISNESPHSIKFAIEAGAYYMWKLRKSWSNPRPAGDRQKLAQASYNAGLGHILNAQKRCDNATLYLDIIKCLPQITGKHSEETITYIIRIQYWYLHILYGG